MMPPLPYTNIHNKKSIWLHGFGKKIDFFKKFFEKREKRRFARSFFIIPYISVAIQ
jgi:hypothetical protein